MTNTDSGAWLNNEQVQQIVGCSHSRAGKLIRMMNEELEKAGYIVALPGRIPKEYFYQRIGLKIQEH